MLSTTELEQYHREGLTIPQHALPVSYVQQVRDKVETFTAAHPHLDPDYIPSIVEHDFDWLEYAKHPDVLDCVEQVIGRDIVVWGSALFCKLARGGKATPWHQDGQYWPIRPLATCTVWIAFDEVSAENGCMRFVPGSHLDKRTYEHETDNSDAYTLNQTVTARAEAEANGKDVELSPGMFSVHDVYLIHGSNRNDSGRRRGGLVFRYMPTTSHFDRDLARAQVRELGVLDISERQLHLVRGGDACGKNDIFQK